MTFREKVDLSSAEKINIWKFFGNQRTIIVLKTWTFPTINWWQAINIFAGKSTRNEKSTRARDRRVSNFDSVSAQTSFRY